MSKNSEALNTSEHLRKTSKASNKVATDPLYVISGENYFHSQNLSLVGSVNHYSSRTSNFLLAENSVLNSLDLTSNSMIHMNIDHYEKLFQAGGLVGARLAMESPIETTQPPEYETVGRHFPLINDHKVLVSQETNLLMNAMASFGVSSLGVGTQPESNTVAPILTLLISPTQ